MSYKDHHIIIFIIVSYNNIIILFLSWSSSHHHHEDDKHGVHTIYNYVLWKLLLTSLFLCMHLQTFSTNATLWSCNFSFRFSEPHRFTTWCAALVLMSFFVVHWIKNVCTMNASTCKCKSNYVCSKWFSI